MTRLVAKSFLLAMTVALISSASVVGARAQDSVGSSKRVSMAQVPALSVTNLAVDQLALKLSRATGVDIVADSSLAATQVSFQTIGGPLDKVLIQLGKALPTGGVVRAALAPDTGSASDGDAVAALLKAQDAFVPKAPSAPAVSGSSTPSGTAVPDSDTLQFRPGYFDLLGQSVTLEQAAPQITSLHLKPVFLLTLRRPGIDPVAKMRAMQADALKQWSAMTPDQQKASMQLMFNSMMNMDPNDRMAMLGQMMSQGSYMMQMMQSMPPDQQKQFQQEIMQSLHNSGIMPPGANGRGGPAQQ